MYYAKLFMEYLQNIINVFIHYCFLKHAYYNRNVIYSKVLKSNVLIFKILCNNIDNLIFA